jgi:hypothetical protein
METVTEHGMTVHTRIILDAESGVLSEHVTLSMESRPRFPRNLRPSQRPMLDLIREREEHHDLPA